MKKRLYCISYYLLTVRLNGFVNGMVGMNEPELKI
jgi:hypothetical protein